MVVIRTGCMEKVIGDDGEPAVELVVEAHEPHGVERVYNRETPSVEAVCAVCRPWSGMHIPRCRKDALIDRSLGEGKQLVVRRCVRSINVVR